MSSYPNPGVPSISKEMTTSQERTIFNSFESNKSPMKPVLEKETSNKLRKYASQKQFAFGSVLPQLNHAIRIPDHITKLGELRESNHNLKIAGSIIASPANHSPRN